MKDFEPWLANFRATLILSLRRNNLSVSLSNQVRVFLGC